MLKLVQAALRPIALRLVVVTLPLAAVFAPSDAHEIRTDTLVIVHPYTLEPALAAAAEANVYMVIRNVSATADRLLAAQTPVAKSVSLETQAGPSTAGIPLPATAETTVGPQATFVVMHGLTESLEGYQYIPMTLVFERAGSVEIEVYVAAPDEQPEPSTNQKQP